MTESGARLHPLEGPGRAALRDFADRDTLFAFDLDGTLAPIVPEPSRIVVPPDLRARLACLERLAPVAVITGRSRADAGLHLGFQPRLLVGNHGAEGLPGREGEAAGYRRLTGMWEEQLRGLLPEAGRAGIVVENKGATLSLHYRNAPDRAEAHRAILGAAEGLEPPPRVLGGKCVENLLPREAPGKGEALLALMRELGFRKALFVGDDETDEEVFRLAAAPIFGIRVGLDPHSAARAYLRDQGEVGPLIDAIIAVLASPRDPGERRGSGTRRSRPGTRPPEP